jgi:hypothetical protein
MIFARKKGEQDSSPDQFIDMKREGKEERNEQRKQNVRGRIGRHPELSEP